MEEHRYSHRVLARSILTRPDGGAALAGQTLCVGGWIKSRRTHRGVVFLALSDGSCASSLQVIVDPEKELDTEQLHTGSCVLVKGELVLSPGKGQAVELHAREFLHAAPADASKYPIAKTKLPPEFLRTVLHLRPRTDLISSVARIRSALVLATHTFFQQQGFIHVHTPIITTSDCEGAGEMFQVTTLLAPEKREHLVAPTQDQIDAARELVTRCGDTVRKLKENKSSSKAEIGDAVKQLKAAKDEEARLVKRAEDGGADYSADFFGRPAFLTVSGQLQAETYACALSNVYTFGPTFRAEQSHTSRHLAEFLMVEPELAFAELKDDMDCAEDYVKFMCQWLLDRCYDDIKLMDDKLTESGALERLQNVVSAPFARITYTQAIEMLKEVKDFTFDTPVEWGMDLASEHERYLAEQLFQKPVFVYDYPKAIKAFYMRVNDDGQTVAAMDMLVPKVGELVGGSQREERYEVLVQRLEELELPLDSYEWYLDLRRYGSVKHSGFGLGFERMLLFVTGLENIRDVIPFPRSTGKAEL
ncbi:hypothetical protein SELMODRAFT_418417 [Selaginella moellendorffii]|uniref:asparagine--tRNA ligase n=1 Tax=Selaginella moellendorffii TaxID=88036 RepID=D8S5M5_SELML|nr:asparagine--tRNA ligase, cytoplasmic 1 [Selaginella moellendorffii]EFJ20082.1 hypothetical protein SELMODRAFT_418417 [Selaginella moellendorffii]|eukprot:XP_002978635.1 asparagine--tRNA ligase, cytoplasmic 1 [Selaginella moellendorffii]